ncbi:phosphomevalonate kinase [Corallococcus exiguus]|uniref:mevalonate kinase family protein n=1 Tax=Corallococcus TaxID=83461 RepID=UPI000EA22E97|nr:MULTISPECIES: phosphomevalonate kinase [Corallococcus]NNC16039.1 phosphomevalonate kinase [Corallococcus exiguus]NRD51721.1 phosphomevalonate kinase [Corallococcus exiguus]RKH28129.1 phosphomevalonate kinase [Corallococcus sp. CA041A]RKI02434.1 phosphomevalonate kinase [Corallococcus sp. AB030]
MDRALSAPGKLFISGEYAVLWGGVSRLAAVAPRTAAYVRRRQDSRVHICLEEGTLQGLTTPRGVKWDREVPAGFSFVARTLDEALRAHGRASVGFDVAVAPGALGPGGHKLGIGGSASATVLAAEAARFVLEEKFDVLKLALTAHTLGQGGKGSGGDVATSFAGGAVRYRRYDITALADAANTGRFNAALAESPPVDLWRMPVPRVSMLYAFTGESASTKLLIGQVEARLADAGRRAFVERSDALGHTIEDGLGGGDFRAFSEAVKAQHALLLELGPLETEGMRRVLAIAASYHCAGKLSGAGGGDGCILFAPDAQAREALREGLESRGFLTLTLDVEQGVRGEAQTDARLRGWVDALT